MKTAIVYYSMGGNTAMVAEKLAEALSADLVPVRPQRAYPDKGFRKFLWGGKSAVMAETPELEPYAFPADQYGRIVFGFPAAGVALEAADALADQLFFSFFGLVGKFGIGIALPAEYNEISLSFRYDTVAEFRAVKSAYHSHLGDLHDLFDLFGKPDIISMYVMIACKCMSGIACGFQSV